MSEELTLQVERQRECWFGWLKWRPTSLTLLREAEKRLLHNLKSSYRGHYVNVGCIANEKESHIWTLSFNETATNVPIILIHGFGSGSGLWCLNFDSLSMHRPVYAFDILGFGRSSRTQLSGDPLEVEREFVNSIEEWRKVLNLSKFILLGHSFGGFLATSYAIKYPQRVSHLILADPWGFPDRPLDVGERYNLPLWVKVVGAVLQPFNPLFLIRTAGPLGPKILQKARPDLIHKFSGLIKDAEEVIPNYLYHCNAQNPSGESAFHSMMSGFGWAKYPMIHRIDALRKEVPVTLIYGARSWVDRDPGFQIKYMRKDAYVDVQIIQGAGHHVYADRAEEFNSLVANIAHHVDEGTVPLQNREIIHQNEGHTAFSTTLSNMINVRYDEIHDEPAFKYLKTKDTVKEEEESSTEELEE